MFDKFYNKNDKNTQKPTIDLTPTSAKILNEFTSVQNDLLMIYNPRLTQNCELIDLVKKELNTKVPKGQIYYGICDCYKDSLKNNINPVYWKSLNGEGHWNEKGHQLISNFLSKELEDTY